MSSSAGFDPRQYKEGVRREWGNSASAWKKSWPTWERATQPVNDRLVELAGVQPGDRVLDVATGLGEPAITATQMVGPTGSVLGIDIAPEMVAAAREEADRLKISNIDFLEMDAEAPNLAENSFDAILCRLGLFFLPNLDKAMTALRQLLIPGGRFASAVWGYPKKCPFNMVVMGTIRKALNAPPPAAGTPGTFSLSDEGLLHRVYTESGFVEVRIESLDILFEYTSFDEFVHERYTTSASIRTMLSSVAEDARADIWRQVGEAVATYTDAEGTIRLPSQILCVVGQRPL